MITIKNSELEELVKAAMTEEIQDDFYVIGLRFENKARHVGDIIEEVSRDNSDREDDRDFPEYGTDEYEGMEELEGISSWDINFWEEVNLNSWSDSTSFDADYIYLIGGERHSYGPDDHELVIEDATVISVIAAKA
ncbi:MAG: hypothetical protein GY797_18635 [Deltaproteobacteria bacterium]|nr:hypothetical protein [Deltaproteobacteria bacterium]